MTTFLIATRNRHKVQEIRAVLGDTFGYLSLDDFPGAPAIREEAATFMGNAALKADGLAKWLTETPAAAVKLADSADVRVLADDSGLEVDALDGAPGVHSARFAALDAGTEGNSPDAANSAKLLRLLAHVPAAKRTARFQCMIAVAPVPWCGDVSFFGGTCEGRIASAPSGTGGFGYDPLFIPNGFAQSFAELGEETKNRLSHRAAALIRMRTELMLR